MTGTVVNALGILAGTAVGLLLGRLIPEKLGDAVTKGVALCVFYIGVSGMLADENTLVMIVSMVLGVLVGELLRLDDRLNALGAGIERRFAAHGIRGRVSEGFVTASLLFCVGAMAIVGALESGLTGSHETLFAKTVLDTVSSVVYASAMGFGVAISAIPVLLYQGVIALGASLLSPVLTDVVIAEMKAVGSLLIVALSLNMLGLTKIKVMNAVPAVFFPILLCTFM
ncbi:MAG: DUF554 domain-containing protein [Oscillospiraceae bacterium]|nr:DUF554 domain-containing protein [Oscillospiraceae bacterium]